MPDFPSRILFKPTITCPRMDRAVTIDGDLSEWEGIPALPALPEMDWQEPLAQLTVAWSEDGLYIAERCPKPVGTVAVNRRSPHAGDGLQVWIDTRATQTGHRATRFCHHFVLLPKGGGGMRENPLAWQGNIRRTRERAPLCDPDEIRIASSIGEEEYTIEAHLPASILNGYEPEPGGRISFNYFVHDIPGGRQFWSSPRGFPGDWDPSLWAVLELGQ